MPAMQSRIDDGIGVAAADVVAWNVTLASLFTVRPPRDVVKIPELFAWLTGCVPRGPIAVDSAYVASATEPIELSSTSTRLSNKPLSKCLQFRQRRSGSA